MSNEVNCPIAENLGFEIKKTDGGIFVIYHHGKSIHACGEFNECFAFCCGVEYGISLGMQVAP